MTSNRKKGAAPSLSAEQEAKATETHRFAEGKRTEGNPSAKEWAMLQSVAHVRQNVLAAAEEARARDDSVKSINIPSSLLDPLGSLPRFVTVDELKGNMKT
jgi:hypothetical protein